jgi:polysaccharide biosynthesis PFTS motif protein
MRLDRKTLSNKYNLKYDKSKKYISIFDSPPVAYSFRPSSQFVPDPNTAEYNRAFMGDMYKLFTNSANISLLYKPKRSLVSGKFHYDDELRNMLGRMEKDPRFVSFDYNINPWVVIALSDICISMPFESPTIAAIHYGKIGLFHDPLNIAVYHRYEGFKEIVTHGYDAMKLLVDSCFNEGIGIDGMLDRGRLSILQGAAPGDNSSDRFRAYINSV